MSNFFTPELNNESAIAPWNASLEPTKAIIPQLDANRVLTGSVGQEVNLPTLMPEAYDNIILPDASLTRMASAVSTDSNISLPDSSVDLLTGQAMSEVYGDLSKFAADPDFAAKLNVPFGENWDAAAAKTLAEAWFKGDFSDIPPVKVVSSGEIGGANGAFAAATDTIYLSKEFLAGNAANPAAVADVLLEEIGHSVDSRLNVTDSPGDEGAIFGAIVQGKELSEGELQGLKSEDDSGTVLFNGQTISIEKAFDWGNNWGVQSWNWNGNSKSWEPLWNGQAKDFGSATRSDGKKGFAQDWGNGSPGNGVNNDFFLLGFWTQANFEKDQSYKFKVRADDRYYIAAYPINGNKWELINWEGKEDAYGGKEIQWKPENNGKYWLFSYYMERDSKAYFDISWDKVSSEPPLFSNPSPSNPLRGFVHPLQGAGSLTQGANGSLSHKGRSQYALDYGTDGIIGKPVYAMRSGTVKRVIDGYPDTGGGEEKANQANMVVIEHDGGYRSAYLHLQNKFTSKVPGGIKEGASVSAGQLIGYSGNSGYSTGPHLHVEVHKPENGFFGQTVPFQIG
ncbi:M23 family metallopeptidase [Microcoleus sp.]|uniref:M23 family metallopeptidase n=1 Tax=Microcoleus sp. TaxID=44472 RepID=UPI003525FC4E